MTFETLVIILLSVVITLQVINTTAMTVFIYLGWRHDQNLDNWCEPIAASIKLLHETVKVNEKNIEQWGVDLTEQIRSIRDTDDGK